MWFYIPRRSKYEYNATCSIVEVKSHLVSVDHPLCFDKIVLDAARLLLLCTEVFVHPSASAELMEEIWHTGQLHSHVQFCLRARFHQC